MTVLKADSVTGQIRNDVGNPVEISGLLKGYGTVSGKEVTFTSQYSDNLGELSAAQREALGAVNAMYASLKQDGRKSELRRIYNLDAGSTKTALDQIGSSPAPQMMSAVQAGNVANRVISDRLSRAFSLQEVKADVPVPVSHFADGEKEKGLTVPVKLEVPVPADNDVWVKFTKNWGELKGDADYHGQAISGGYDRAVGEHWRAGAAICTTRASVCMADTTGMPMTRLFIWTAAGSGTSCTEVFRPWAWGRRQSTIPIFLRSAASTGTTCSRNGPGRFRRSSICNIPA